MLAQLVLYSVVLAVAFEIKALSCESSFTGISLSTRPEEKFFEYNKIADVEIYVTSREKPSNRGFDYQLFVRRRSIDRAVQVFAGSFVPVSGKPRLVSFDAHREIYFSFANHVYVIDKSTGLVNDLGELPPIFERNLAFFRAHDETVYLTYLAKKDGHTALEMVGISNFGERKTVKLPFADKSFVAKLRWAGNFLYIGEAFEGRFFINKFDRDLKLVEKITVPLNPYYVRSYDVSFDGRFILLVEHNGFRILDYKSGQMGRPYFANAIFHESHKDPQFLVRFNPLDSSELVANNGYLWSVN